MREGRERERERDGISLARRAVRIFPFFRFFFLGFWCFFPLSSGKSFTAIWIMRRCTRRDGSRRASFVAIGNVTTAGTVNQTAADVTLASRLTGMERRIDGHKHVTVEHRRCSTGRSRSSDVSHIISVIGIREVAPGSRV